jgi:hypothetical protein
VPTCRHFDLWRDPDSNRGHHDFQGRERTLTSEESACKSSPLPHGLKSSVASDIAALMQVWDLARPPRPADRPPTCCSPLSPIAARSGLLKLFFGGDVQGACQGAGRVPSCPARRIRGNGLAAGTCRRVRVWHSSGDTPRARDGSLLRGAARERFVVSANKSERQPSRGSSPISVVDRRPNGTGSHSRSN